MKRELVKGLELFLRCHRTVYFVVRRGRRRRRERRRRKSGFICKIED
jgi:hypothetical protein